VLSLLLRLLHPIIPYVTEELWDHFGYGEPGSLIREPWPEIFDVLEPEAAAEEVNWVIRLISEVRTVRSEMNVPPSMKTPIFLQDAAPPSLARTQNWFEAISRMGRASEIGPLTGEVPKGSAQAVLGEATLILPLGDVIDLAAERARLTAMLAKAEAELAKVTQKLANTDFTARAPEAILDEHYERSKSFAAEVARLTAALARIS
jgi:valyl-tRNA synthetase